MRKREVDAARVDIERLAQVLHRHRGALDMPSRPARPDHGVPEWLAFLGRLPQRKVAGIGLLVAVRVRPRAGPYAAEVGVRQLPILGEPGDPEIDGAVALVGVALFAQLEDDLGHVLNMVGGADQVLGALQAPGPRSLRGRPTVEQRRRTR